MLDGPFRALLFLHLTYLFFSFPSVLHTSRPSLLKPRFTYVLFSKASLILLVSRWLLICKPSPALPWIRQVSIFHCLLSSGSKTSFQLSISASPTSSTVVSIYYFPFRLACFPFSLFPSFPLPFPFFLFSPSFRIRQPLVSFDLREDHRLPLSTAPVTFRGPRLRYLLIRVSFVVFLEGPHRFWVESRLSGPAPAITPITTPRSNWLDTVSPIIYKHTA